MAHSKTRSVLLLACPIFFQVVFANAQTYPEKPVRVIIPFAAGAGSDITARVVANDMQQRLGTTFVVDNRPGANGLLAAETVARAAPDGYTLFFTTVTTQAANPSLYKKLPYDPIRDFTPVGRISLSQHVLVVHPSIKANSAQELVQLARSQPGKLSYATSNAGSLVSSEWLKAIAQVDIVGVPYNSNPTALTDLVAGRIQVMFPDQNSVTPMISSGKVRALASTGLSRLLKFPDVPTMQESGFKGFTINVWSGVYGPAGLPQTVVQQLNVALEATLKNPATLEKFAAAGSVPSPLSPEQFAQFARSELDVWKSAIAAAKIELQ
ncbi:MAG: Bug family tripartite tricarboxylate transporter substrate binding protein [Burkholderiales bacterium]